MLSSPLSLRTALLAMAAMVAFAPSANAQFAGEDRDLDTVLALQPDMTMFRNLVQIFPEVFSMFPEEGVTIIAPNDFAFARVGNWGGKSMEVMEASLKYHVIKKPINTAAIEIGDHLFAATRLDDPRYSNVTGGQQLILTKQPGGDVVLISGFATRGTVVVENIPFESGLVQVVDSVLRIPEPLKATALDAYTDLTAFMGALAVTGIADEVLAAKDVTVLAPTNAAFQNLAGVLYDTPQDELKRILRYHIIPNTRLHSWELKNGSFLVSSEDKKPVGITRHANHIYANSAQFLQTDILLSNGLVQMIDNVLSPNHPHARPDFAATAQRPVLTPAQAVATVTVTRIVPYPTGTCRKVKSAASRHSGLLGVVIGVGLVVALFMGL